MVNISKRKGTAFETGCVEFLHSEGFNDAERRPQYGSNDKGDVKFSNYILECKNTQKMDMATGMNELEKEIVNANVSFGFLVFKRQRRSVRDAYVVMSFTQLTRLLKLVGGDEN